MQNSKTSQKNILKHTLFNITEQRSDFKKIVRAIWL